MKHHFQQKGFTIIEIIITISFLSFAIIGIYSAFAPSLRLSRVVSAKFIGVYLAQEGLEVVRNLRDNNFLAQNSWSKGLLDCQLGCQLDYKTGTALENQANKLRAYDPSEFLKLGSNNLYSYDAGQTTIYQRKVTITSESGTDTLKVAVKVTWSDAGIPYQFEAAGYLYNWD